MKHFESGGVFNSATSQFSFLFNQTIRYDLVVLRDYFRDDHVRPLCILRVFDIIAELPFLCFAPFEALSNLRIRKMYNSSKIIRLCCACLVHMRLKNI